MGAETTFLVHIMRLVDDEIEVSAVTEDEALQKAFAMPGVAHVVKAFHPDEDRLDRFR